MAGIEQYLAEVRGLLHLRSREADRLLEEIEAHLLDAADASCATGASRAQAEHQAVERFGTAAEIADAANGGTAGRLARTTGALSLLGAAGCLAVLVGAFAARDLAALTSTRWVFGLPAGAAASSADAHHWLAVQPGARTWQGAAALENAHDSIALRGGAALVGMVLALGFAAVVLRRYRPTLGAPLLTWSAVAFASTGAALLALGALGVPALDWGQGQALCDAAVATGSALLCLRVRGRLRETRAD